MAILKILIQGNPVLKKRSRSVSRITRDHLELINDMVDTMKAAPGVGLAAPQVGQSVRIIVANAGEDLYCLINPKIAKKKGRQAIYEGCLSVPGLEAPIERAEKVTVKALDMKGKAVTIEAEGLLAVVFQHEIDHLDGILFIERVGDPSTIRLKEPTKEETI